MAKGYGKRMGDRKEGRRLRGLNASAALLPYVMRRRSDACNSYDDALEVTEIEQWLLQKRAEGSRGLNLTHLLVAAYVRTVSMRPGVNRFVSGRRVFARSGIQVVLRIPRGMDSDAPWTSIKVSCSPTDTIYDVYRRVSDAVDEVQAGTGESAYDRLAASVARLPRGALRFLFFLLRWLDYHDWLPQSLLDASPYHGSLSICDTGSLGIEPVTHHIYDFGNLPVYLSFGAKHRRYEYDREGQLLERHFVDYRITSDERIADGSTCADALKCMKYFLKNPQLLEQPPETVEDDIN